MNARSTHRNKGWLYHPTLAPHPASPPHRPTYSNGRRGVRARLLSHYDEVSVDTAGVVFAIFPSDGARESSSSTSSEGPLLSFDATD